MPTKHTKKNKSKRKRTASYLEAKLQESIKSVPVTETIHADINQRKTRKRYLSYIFILKVWEFRLFLSIPNGR